MLSALRPSNLIVGAREAFIWITSYLVSWLALSPSPAAFRHSQELAAAESVEFILRIQKWRAKFPWLDMYFRVWTFTGESDFYFILLPLMFWLVDPWLAVNFTLVVVLGLVAGNVLKDVFHLPRPFDLGTAASAKIFRPAFMLHSDSTGLQDFGFPSTHSLNAITNPAVILSFLFANGTLSFSTCPLFSVFAILLGAFHAGNLILSRLYFGVHSINDCTAGVILGVLEMVVFNSLYSQFEHWMLHSAASPYYVFIFLSALLFMCPQPRPRTPTFLQTAQCVGLAIGCAIGHRWRFLRAPVTEPLLPWLLTLQAPLRIPLRLAVGFAVVLAVDVIGKLLMTKLVQLCTGVDVRVPFTEAESEQPARRRRRGSADSPKLKYQREDAPGEDPTDRAFAHPDDSQALAVRIGSEAAVKVGKYAAVALAISCGAPYILELLGLGTPPLVFP